MTLLTGVSIGVGVVDECDVCDDVNGANFGGAILLAMLMRSMVVGVVAGTTIEMLVAMMIVVLMHVPAAMVPVVFVFVDVCAGDGDGVKYVSCGEDDDAGWHEDVRRLAGGNEANDGIGQYALLRRACRAEPGANGATDGRDSSI